MGNQYTNPTTEAEIAEAKSLFAEGLSINVISKRLHRAWFVTERMILSPEVEIGKPKKRAYLFNKSEGITQKEVAKKPLPPKTSAIDLVSRDPSCIGCHYYRALYDNSADCYCNYADMTGVLSRNKICPPGKLCTVRKEEGNIDKLGETSLS